MTKYVRLKPNDKIALLTLVEKIDGEKKWLCKCDCGNECIKSNHSLYQRDRDTLSCGCSMYQYEKGNKNYMWKGFGEISGKLWSLYMANARRRNIEFHISMEDAWNQFIKQKKCCALSGELLLFPRSTGGKINASLDRIDPDLPYDINNVQWIHKDINNMKFDLKEEDFLYYCYLIVNPLNHNKINVNCYIDKKHNNWRGFGNISRDYWGRIIRRSNKAHITLNITIEDLWNKFLEQRGYCAITGLPLSLHRYNKTYNASLDRINNAIGYEISNIQWIHKIINTKIKKSLDEVKIKHWCNKIINYRGYS